MPDRSTLTVLAALGLAGCATGDANDTAEVSGDWLRSAVVRIQTVEPGSGYADLMALKPVIGSSRVVAMGEIVHRAHELLAFRNRLFEFLVEEMGFRVIAMETGFPESAVLRDFVRGAELDLDAVAPDVFSWGFHEFRENRDLLHWIREYNLDPAHGEPIRIYGFELPGGTSGVYFSHAARFVESGLDYLSSASPSGAKSIRARLGPLLPFFNDHEYSSLHQEQRDRLSAAINDLAAALEQHRFELIERSSAEEWEWAYQTACAIRQLDDWFRTIPPGWRPTEEQPWSPNMHQALTARDFGMWENVQWILAREAPDRVFLFAHNHHLQNSVNLRPEGPTTVLGQHLKASLGDEVFTIGSVHGSMVNQDAFGHYWARASALAERLSKLDLSVLLLDLRGQPWPESEQSWWTARQRFEYGFQTDSLPPAEIYDAWLYVEQLTPHASW